MVLWLTLMRLLTDNWFLWRKSCSSTRTLSTPERPLIFPRNRRPAARIKMLLLTPTKELNKRSNLPSLTSKKTWKTSSTKWRLIWVKIWEEHWSLRSLNGRDPNKTRRKSWRNGVFNHRICGSHSSGTIPTILTWLSSVLVDRRFITVPRNATHVVLT